VDIRPLSDRSPGPRTESDAVPEPANRLDLARYVAVGNTATGSGGGAIFVPFSGPDLTVTNSRFIGNIGTGLNSDGGAIAVLARPVYRGS
jgi:hypothetical protein